MMNQPTFLLRRILIKVFVKHGIPMTPHRLQMIDKMIEQYGMNISPRQIVMALEGGIKKLLDRKKSS